jgi:transcriptional regulator with XRE-family HTH domain
MPSTIRQLDNARLEQHVVELGRQIRQRRKALGVSATSAAEAAGMSRVTWYRIEKGEVSVTIGAWFNALAVLGLEFGIGESSSRVDVTARAPGQAAVGATDVDTAISLPLHIRLQDYPQLQALAWQVVGSETISAREALDIYNRNRRHIDWEAMQPAERQLIDALHQVFGEPGRV